MSGTIENPFRLTICYHRVFAEHLPAGATPMAENLPVSSDARDDSSIELFRVLYNELRRLARRQMRRESPGHTLDPTGLVHEAFLRLDKCRDVRWNSRGHFLGAAARAMRRILVERARRHGRLKHGGGLSRVALDDLVLEDENGTGAIDILALDEALDRLFERDPRKHQVVMLRFFAGVSLEDTADALGISLTTVKSDWRFARAWLFREMGHEPRGN